MAFLPYLVYLLASIHNPHCKQTQDGGIGYSLVSSISSICPRLAGHAVVTYSASWLLYPSSSTLYHPRTKDPPPAQAARDAFKSYSKVSKF